MGINYREEVDSGFDRKRIVESAIINCLKEGIPLEIIRKCKYFNIRHNEMLKNLRRNYNTKLKEIAETYNNSELDLAVVPDNFSKVSHPVGGELYPMNHDETICKFKRLGELNSKIAEHKVVTYKKNIKQCEENLKEYINNNPIIITILVL